MTAHDVTHDDPAALAAFEDRVWRSRLKGHVKVVALALSRLADPDDDLVAAPTLDELQDLVCMGRQTIVQALAELERAGWIDVDRGDDEYLTEYTLR